MINTKVLKENVVYIEIALTGEPSNSKNMDFLSLLKKMLDIFKTKADY